MVMLSRFVVAGVSPTLKASRLQLKHLDVLPVLGDLLRAYAIRLYWTPNYLLAGEQATADALYSAVPDLGGYLLKIGSEKQGVSCQDIAAV